MLVPSSPTTETARTSPEKRRRARRSTQMATSAAARSMAQSLISTSTARTYQKPSARTSKRRALRARLCAVKLTAAGSQSLSRFPSLNPHTSQSSSLPLTIVFPRPQAGFTTRARTEKVKQYTSASITATKHQPKSKKESELPRRNTHTSAKPRTSALFTAIIAPVKTAFTHQKRNGCSKKLTPSSAHTAMTNQTPWRTTLIPTFTIQFAQNR